ncbi:MAG: Gfo/Idh/MocA family oxidoreductase [Chloroflexi bacterium]|nr:Gfo/Idh/MocA family oxidoreductase [Chloroflexota bacterium]
MTTPRLALIGCGRIAEFHAPACREAGLELTAVCSRPGSARLHPFAKRHGIPNVFDSVDSLLRARDEWDALLIAVTVEETLEVLLASLASDAPILVEKPVALTSEELVPLLGRGLPVIVGYNRRFYRTVQEARREVADDAPPIAQLVVPESIRTQSDGEKDGKYLRPFFVNSVHALDMARHVFGRLSVQHVRRAVGDSGEVAGIAALIGTEAGTVLQFTANWGAPANFSLSLDWPGRRLELKPFESATVYKGMEVREPTRETPIRSYVPTQTGRVDLDEVDSRFKPGFVGQAEALGRLVRGEDPAPAAGLEDAYEALKLAETLVGQRYSASPTPTLAAGSKR